MAGQDLHEALLELEREGWNSLCESTGDEFYGRTMSDDAVMVLAHGEVMDRSMAVAALSQAPPWKMYDISQSRVVETGPDSAALVYLGTAYRQEDEPAFIALMSSVYVRQHGEWRLALYQQTPIQSEKH